MNIASNEKYAIRVRHAAGRTFYVSKTPGHMSCRVDTIWTGTKGEALVLQACMGRGEVVAFGH